MSDAGRAVTMDKTLVKGLGLLERLALAPEAVRLADLARETGLTKSGVHRLLQTLVRLGYVRAADGGRYAATLKLWHLGSRVIDRLDLRQTLHPRLEALAQAMLETVHLAVLDGTEVVYIDKADGQHLVRVYVEIGGRAPAYCVATGKVLLAERPEAAEALAPLLERHTARTITDPLQLRRELARVRRNGYALNRGEWVDQVCGVAAPVLGAQGRPVAALGVTVPAIRFTPSHRTALVRQVRQAARHASHALGANPDAHPAAA